MPKPLVISATTSVEASSGANQCLALLLSSGKNGNDKKLSGQVGLAKPMKNMRCSMPEGDNSVDLHFPVATEVSSPLSWLVLRICGFYKLFLNQFRIVVSGLWPGVSIPYPNLMSPYILAGAFKSAYSKCTGCLLKMGRALNCE